MPPNKSLGASQSVQASRSVMEQSIGVRYRGMYGQQVVVFACDAPRDDGGDSYSFSQHTLSSRSSRIFSADKHYRSANAAISPRLSQADGEQQPAAQDLVWIRTHVAGVAFATGSPSTSELECTGSRSPVHHVSFHAN